MSDTSISPHQPSFNYYRCRNLIKVFSITIESKNISCEEFSNEKSQKIFVARLWCLATSVIWWKWAFEVSPLQDIIFMVWTRDTEQKESELEPKYTWFHQRYGRGGRFWTQILPSNCTLPTLVQLIVVVFCKTDGLGSIPYRYRSFSYQKTASISHIDQLLVNSRSTKQRTKIEHFWLLRSRRKFLSYPIKCQIQVFRPISLHSTSIDVEICERNITTPLNQKI